MLKKLRMKMARKMKTDNGNARQMTEEEIRKYKEEIEGEKDDD